MEQEKLKTAVFDGERRWRDLELGEWLDMPNIRTVIKRNEAELERHGILSCHTTNSRKRGRPGKEYWLNFGQALLVCLLSRSPVCHAMIRVLAHVGARDFATLPSLEQWQIKVLAQSAVEPLLHQDG